MNTKIQKIDAEIDKTRVKITDYQARLRELERQKTEIENTEIVELVRSVDATPRELATFILTFREQNGAPSSLHQKEDMPHE